MAAHVKLDGALNLVGTKASSTDVDMARSTVNNSLYALDVGLPSSVRTSVRVRDFDTKGHALAADIAFCHLLHLLATYRFSESARKRLSIIADINKNCKEKFANRRKIFCMVANRAKNGYNVGEVRSLEFIYSVPLTSLVEEFHLIPLHKAEDFSRIHITVDDVSRPGLQLAGFFDHFEPMRLQVLGNVETSYLQKLSSEQRAIIFDHLFSYKIPALVIARNLEPLPECLEMAKKHDITLLRSQDSTSYIVSSLITSLKTFLAPRITRHGVLVEIYGEGILILGDSGIGKSEAAVELVKRGHRLVADDAVELKRISSSELIGGAPDVLRHYIELRGIGVINVAKLFGMGAVKDSASVDLIINIVPWQDGEIYDRLGLESQYTDILGVKIPSITVPVTPGRNLAVIFEVAAMNNRQKRMGYNAAAEFTEQLSKFFQQNADAPKF